MKGRESAGILRLRFGPRFQEQPDDPGIARRRGVVKGCPAEEVSRREIGLADEEAHDVDGMVLDRAVQGSPLFFVAGVDVRALGHQQFHDVPVSLARREVQGRAAFLVPGVYLDAAPPELHSRQLFAPQERGDVQRCSLASGFFPVHNHVSATLVFPTASFSRAGSASACATSSSPGFTTRVFRLRRTQIHR